MNHKILYQFENSDVLRRFGKGLIIDFQGKRRVLSTSMLNGGLHDSLTHVFNYNCLADEYDCELHCDTYEEELKENARNLELDPACCTGLSTGAYIECVAIHTEEFKDISVTAIVTGGIDHNAVRVGDPASYYEHFNIYTPLKPGTINIVLTINQSMPAGAMVRAASMCTEAKSAAIAELLIGSNYSSGIATGSGTDGIIVVSDLDCPTSLTDAGGHSKLGELIGLTVKQAVKQALLNQTSASPARQHSILERGKRFGVTLSSLWDCYQTMIKNLPEDSSMPTSLSLKELETTILAWHQNSNLLVFSSLYFHLMDQYEWKLIEWPEILRESRTLCHWFLSTTAINTLLLPSISYTTNQPVNDLLQLYQHAVLLRMLSC